MKKFIIDELAYIRAYDAEDLRDGETFNKLMTFCENIIKSYKGSLNTEKELTTFRDKLSDFFLQDSDCLTVVLFSKEGLPEEANARPKAFSFFSHDKETDLWKLNSIYKKFQSDSKFPRLLIQSCFDYLKTHDSKKIAFSVANNDSRPLKFFKSLDNIYPSSKNELPLTTEFLYDLKDYLPSIIKTETKELVFA